MIAAKHAPQVRPGDVLRGSLGVIDSPLPSTSTLAAVAPDLQARLVAIAEDQTETDLIRGNALRVLGELRGVDPLLLEYAGGKEPSLALRVAALDGLRRQPTDVLRQHLGVLQEWLVEPEAPVSVAAGLACLRVPEGRGVVRMALDSSTLHPASQRVLNRALNDVDD